MEMGTVKWFNNAKGYGFILHDDGNDVFVHYKAIEGDGFLTLHEGEQVEFVAEDGPKGIHATAVKRIEAEA